MTIEFDSRKNKQDGINAAVASLGHRKGDDHKAISEDLKKALRERDLGLDDPVRDQVASLLADGEEVQVGVNS